MPPFKDQIGAASVRQLGDELAAVAPWPDVDALVAAAVDGLGPLELKARIRRVAAALVDHLPPLPEAAAGVRAAAAASAGGAWVWWPLTDWIELAGRRHWAEAVDLLGHVTHLASGEFALRPYVDDDPERARAVLATWADGPDPHRRRLVSEGTRPRLPWAPRLATAEADPGWAVPLLDRLREDPSPDVRRSVANHLNDLARVAPALALDVAGRWLAEGGEHAGAVVRHGLRGRVKAGDPAALELLGHPADAALEVVGLGLEPAVVELGGAVTFAFELRSADPRTVDVVVDYALRSPRARGGESRKVFKLARFTLAPGARRTVTRRHAVVPVTTRVHRAGAHAIDIQVNGVVRASAPFTLAVPGPA